MECPARAPGPLGLLLIAIVGCTPSPPPRRSVLLLTLDTTRWDAVGFLNGAAEETPNLDRLAAESVVFEDALTVAPLTLPAHTSLLTDLYPLRHGVRDNGLYRLPEAATTLAEVLGDAGWTTGAAVAACVLDAGYGIDQGFAAFDAPDPHGDLAAVTYVERPAREMVDRALDFLGHADGPFFYWLHLYDPHAPYDSHGPTAPLPASGDPRDLTRRQYAEEVRAMDEEIGRLFRVLSARGQAEDLVVVVAADHGESLGEHGESTHGYFLFDSTMKVPLLIRDPDLAPQRVTAPVSLVDVMPTLLSLLDVPPPDVALDGLDLAPGLRGQEPFPDGRLRLIESRHLYDNLGWAPYEGLVRGPWKYVHSRHDALYDRVEDPTERLDLAREHPEVMSEYARGVEEWFGQDPSLAMDRWRPDASGLDALAKLGYVLGRSAGSVDRPDPALLPAAEDRLELLRQWDEATQAMVQGRTLVAADLLRDLVRRSPGSADFQGRLGVVLMSLGDEDLAEAEAALQEAVRLQPRSPEPCFNLGICSLKREALARRAGEEETLAGYRRQALRAFQACLALEPDFPDALALCGLLGLRVARVLDRDEPARLLREESLDLLRRFLEVAPADHPRRERCREALENQTAGGAARSRTRGA